MKFKVGDTIISSQEDKSEGLIGTIVEIRLNSLLVDFGPSFMGHVGNDGKERNVSATCWWVANFLANPFFSVDPISTDKKEEIPPGYRRTEDGFLTNDDNWKPGNRWF